MGQLRLSLPVLLEHFPSTAVYREPRKAQEKMLTFVAETDGQCTIEAPTGSGKTAVERAVAKAWQSNGNGTTFIIAPNKTIIEQIKGEFPELPVALGRNEHPCLYYQPDERFPVIHLEVLRLDPNNPRADEIPCSFLQDCPHRVDQQTGETHEDGATACPYLLAKFKAKQERLVLATMSFYLFTHLFPKTREFDTTGVVIDEAHRLAEVVRNALTYEITDWHLERSEEILKDVSPKTAKVLKRFRMAMVRLSKKKRPNQLTLLRPEEIEKLIAILSEIDQPGLRAAVNQAVASGQIDPREDRVTLRKLEILVRDMWRYITSLEYSIPTDGRKALNYTCAFHRLERGENERYVHKLTVKCYYVAWLIRNRLLPPNRVCLSATIGDEETFGFETGIRDPFISLPSDFPAKNSRIYMPEDTPNLAFNKRGDRDLAKTIRLMVRGAKRFADKGIRSLLVVVSNAEREKAILMAEEEGLKAVSYGNGVTAKDVAVDFRNGRGDSLIGTAANYAEGIDLPKQIAPAIFFLRPSFPSPYDPGSQFEEERFGNQRWALWNWRVMIQALQVRGRNLRSRSDIGATFFMSQQFRRFVFASLPKPLQASYRGEITFEEAMKEAEGLLR